MDKKFGVLTCSGMIWLDGHPKTSAAPVASSQVWSPSLSAGSSVSKYRESPAGDVYGEGMAAPQKDRLINDSVSSGNFSPQASAVCWTNASVESAPCGMVLEPAEEASREVLMENYDSFCSWTFGGETVQDNTDSCSADSLGFSIQQSLDLLLSSPFFVEPSTDLSPHVIEQILETPERFDKCAVLSTPMLSAVIESATACDSTDLSQRDDSAESELFSRTFHESTVQNEVPSRGTTSAGKEEKRLKKGSTIWENQQRKLASERAKAKTVLENRRRERISGERRVRKSYTVASKLRMVEMYAEARKQDEKTMASFCMEHSLNSKGLTSWIKGYDTLKELKRGKRNLRRLRQAGPKFPEVEQRLLAWVLEERSNGREPSPRALHVRAKELCLEMDVTGFSASVGWIRGFSSRLQTTTRDLAENRKSGLAAALEK